MAGDNEPWKLKQFLDSLVVELDKAQDTLALKAVNRPLSYTVKDVALDLQIFPSYERGQVVFSTARPGQTGASRISLQLGSITDRMIREATKGPVGEDDIALEEIEGLDEEAKQSLEQVGVRSARDLERISERKIDLSRISAGKLDYGRLSRIIDRSRGGPKVRAVSLVRRNGQVARLRIEGENLVPTRSRTLSSAERPWATLDGRPASVALATANRVEVLLGDHVTEDGAELTVGLDPERVMRMALTGLMGDR